MEAVMTFDQVDAFLKKLGPVTRGVWWNNPTWKRGSRAVAWQRPLSKADVARLEAQRAPVPSGEVLAIQVESLDEKEALLSLGLPGFFTIAHFDGFSAVLVELRLSRVRDVQQALRRAWSHAEAKAVTRRAKPAARRPRRLAR
jgi:hypothetical protein